MAEIFREKFVEYFENEKVEAPSLLGFYLYDKEFFIKHTSKNESKATWNKRFQIAVTNENIKDYGDEEPDWEEIEKKICTVNKSKTNSSPLKTKLTTQQKAELEDCFNKLDDKKFWYLKASIPNSNKNQTTAKVISVEERMIKFALSCNYYHPSQQLILDLTDPNWDNIFTDAERKEIEDAGCALLRPIDESLAQQLHDLKKMKTAKDVYTFARNIDHDPEDQPLLAWLSWSLQTTSLLYLKKNKFNIQEYLESDKMYYLWVFLNKIFDGSEDIVALGKEKPSTANAAATNRKRKLSAVEPTENLKMGRRTDTTYIGGDGVELGCLEIGKTNNQTKELMDGSIKMPVVMRDMLMKLVEETPSLVNKLHILGYMIMGNKVSLLDMDIPDGYVTRIRRTKPATYPHGSKNFAVRIAPLLQLAAIGKKIVEDTFEIYSEQEISLSEAEAEGPVIPRLYSIPSSSASSASSASSNKRQNTSYN
ncbi:hypothetical protein BDC45DRAFT_475199 [Circinella umbellata]|nr:hypothetical protein BDC45DRAFT_475199 [Circinella umbellata]